MTTSTPAVSVEQAGGRSSESQMAIVLRRFRRHKTAMVSIGVLAFFLMLALLAPTIAPYPRDEPNLDGRFLTPLSTDEAGGFHLLGTDHLGRDYYTRLLYASRTSLGTAIFSTLIASTIGIFLGMLAGYFGGWVDTIISRTLEVVASFPSLPILLILSAVAVQDINAIPIPTLLNNFIAWSFAVNERESRIIFMIIVVLALLGWTSTCRLMRGMVLSVREYVYIESARALGASSWRIMARHVFPNALPPMIVDFTLNVNTFLVSESAISVLGFGIQDPTPTWGNMTNFAEKYMFQHPWMPLIPTLPILLCSMAVNYIGDGLRDALDPHQRG